MNMRRAQIYRQLARLYQELAEMDEPANDATPTRRKRIVPAMPRGPLNPPSELDRARAREAARRIGNLVRVKP